MKLRLYVMDIRELKKADLFEQTLWLLDPVRKEKALRARGEKDRARLAGAGLLLLLAHAGMSGSMEFSGETVSCSENLSEAEQARAEKKDEKTGFQSNECLQILSPDLIIQSIISEEKRRGCPLSADLSYEVSDRGKPTWKPDTVQDKIGQGYEAKTGQGGSRQRQAAYPYFNLSHSGDYAALAAADVPVGIDIQEPRKTLHPSIGDYRKFSRMESYFKCTGRGIDLKIDACYRKMEEAEKEGAYSFRSVPMPDEYALWICTDEACRQFPSGGFHP